MRCAVCWRGVGDFRLVSVGSADVKTKAKGTEGEVGGGAAKDGGEDGDKSVGATEVKKDAETTVVGKDTTDEDLRGKSFLSPLFSSPSSPRTSTSLSSSHEHDLDVSIQEFGAGLEAAFESGEVRASTPTFGRRELDDDLVEVGVEEGSGMGMGKGKDGRSKGRGQEEGQGENVVLRIDNVPWVRLGVCFSTPY